MITATNSPVTQQITAARIDTQTGNNQSQEIRQYNVKASEHNQDFLYTPQVRAPGFADLARPQAGPDQPPIGRGSAVDFSV